MHRIAFEIAGFKIYYYGVMMTLGVLAAYGIVMLRNRRMKVAEPDSLLDCIVWILVTGLLGARIAYVIQRPALYMNDPLSVLNFREGGLTLYGSLVIGTAVFIIFCRRKKLSILKMLDLFAPAVMVGIAFGRIGCFLNGCCYGIPADPPLGVVFADAGIAGPRIPVQLFESLLCLAGAGIIFWLDAIKKADGSSFLAFASLYALIRFVIEFFRSVDSSPVFIGLTFAQLFSIAVALSCAFAYFRIVKSGGLKNDSGKAVDSSDRAGK